MELRVFEQIKNGELTSTHELQVPGIRTNEDSAKLRAYHELLDLISDGYVAGVESSPGHLGPNYTNLKVTKSGLEEYKFCMKPIDQLGKPTFIETVRNGIIGGFAGKVAIFLASSILLVLFPGFIDSVEHYLSVIIKWFCYIIDLMFN